MAMTDEQLLACCEQAARCFDQTANLAEVFNARTSETPKPHDPILSSIFSKTEPEAESISPSFSFGA